MERKIVAADFTVKDFTIKTAAADDTITVISATVDAKNNKLVHLTIDKYGHFADENLQFVYNYASNTINIVPEVPTILDSSWFNSDTGIAVHTNKDIDASEIPDIDFSVKDAECLSHKIKSSDFDDANVVIAELSDKVDLKLDDPQLTFNNGFVKKTVTITPNVMHSSSLHFSIDVVNCALIWITP